MSLFSDLTEARLRLHAQIDASADRHLRYIHAICERDRRAIGQLTRYDHIHKRLSK